MEQIQKKATVTADVVVRHNSCVTVALELESKTVGRNAKGNWFWDEILLEIDLNRWISTG